MPNQTVLFIINKFAGGGFEPTVEGKILDICAANNAECTIEFTRSHGHATVLANEGIQKGFNKIIAVGGDGTVNEVARSLVNTSIEMGIIPKGSGNGLSRHLGIPLNFEKAIENIFSGSPIRMDTFLVNNKLSLNVSGIGFDGHVANLFGKNGRRGLFGYIKLTLREFMRFKEFPLELTIDGRLQKIHAFIVAIANSSQYGNNARIAPLASVMDQRLHITVLKKVPIYASLPFIFRFLMGNVQSSSFCEIYEGRHIEIKTTVTKPFHVDGEPSGSDQFFTITVTPLSLTLVVPANTNRVL